MKDPWAVLAAQAAVVAVTERWTLALLTCLSSLALFAACGVENVSTTFGAIRCNPTPAQYAEFDTGGGILVALAGQNCITCHGSGTTAVPSRFRLKTTGTLTAQDQTNNFCVAYSFGQASPSRSLVTHPNDPKHVGYANGGTGPGGTANLAAIESWVNNTVLAP